MPDFCEWGLGEHGRVFDQPDFVFGVGRARGVEGFHGLKGGGVVGSLPSFLMFMGFPLEDADAGCFWRFRLPNRRGAAGFCGYSRK